MGPRVPFTPALLTFSLRITLHIYLISSLLFILLYVTCVMVNKAVKRKKNKATLFLHLVGPVVRKCAPCLWGTQVE